MTRWATVRDLATVRLLRDTYGSVLAKLDANKTPFPSVRDLIACTAGRNLLRDYCSELDGLCARLERLHPRSSRRFPMPALDASCLPPLAAAAMSAVVAAERLGCRGGAPAAMGHGWPALDLAVGPACEASRTADITLHADPLFHASTVQKLPMPFPSDNVRDNRGDNP